MLPITTLSSFIHTQTETSESIPVGYDKSTGKLLVTNNNEMNNNFTHEVKALVQNTDLFFSRREFRTVLSRFDLKKFESTVGSDDCFKLSSGDLPNSLTVRECKLICTRINQTQNISDLKDTVEEITCSKLSSESKAISIARLGISQRLARVLNSVDKKEVAQCLVMTKCLGLREAELVSLKETPSNKK